MTFKVQTFTGQGTPFPRVTEEKVENIDQVCEIVYTKLLTASRIQIDKVRKGY